LIEKKKNNAVLLLSSWTGPQTNEYSLKEKITKRVWFLTDISEIGESF
jgi:hypothetical protein